MYEHPTSMPVTPGFYAWDGEAWHRFDSMVDMLAMRLELDGVCECRVVEDPITEAIV